MYKPDQKKFNKLASTGKYIPVSRTIPIDLETPVSVFLKLRALGASFLLESVANAQNIGRYSIIGLAPVFNFKVENDEATITHHAHQSKVSLKGLNPLDKLKEALAEYQLADTGDELAKIFAGAMGYVGYDFVQYFENIPKAKSGKLDLPDSLFFLTDTMLVFDHLQRKLTVMVLTVGGKDQKANQASYNQAVSKIEEIIKILSLPISATDLNLPTNKVSSKGKSISNFTQAKFKKAVLQAKKYIKAGDIFQVVLSQRLQGKTSAHPFQVYRALRMLNPSPYMFYLNFGDFQLVGSSPEALVKLTGDKASVRPIAGTRPRGATEKQDEKLALDLNKDAKEKAEHVMLVDLGRNDLGRVSEPGSVKVTDLMTNERYSHVMHLVSNVEGKLEKKYDQFDLFKATFPAGTVSGAPKVRAMEIIQELEPDKRGPYAGAVGYFGLSGNMDTCITIRTIILKNSTYYLQGGAGIVADSKPEKEYKETLNKIKALEKAIESAEKGLQR